MGSGTRLTVALVLLAGAAFAQDERRVVSPDGQVEFHIFINGQPESNLSRLAYQIRVRGKVVIDTSYLGFDIYEQEPLLGETVGMISETRSEGPGYQAFTGRYMQNGSLGRRLNVEARVYNEGVAFRCIILGAASMDRVLIADEATEFDLPHDPKADLRLPFVTQQPGVGRVAITEVPRPGFPVMHLVNDQKILLTRLARHAGVPDVVYEGNPPVTCPWRVIVIGPEQESILRSLREATPASQP
ncbi:MAG: glycoside hydrolase family 97 N-terminal domain-containing protein [Acidobacteriota bacterium]